MTFPSRTARACSEVIASGLSGFCVSMIVPLGMKPFVSLNASRKSEVRMYHALPRSVPGIFPALSMSRIVAGVSPRMKATSSTRSIGLSASLSNRVIIASCFDSAAAAFDRIHAGMRTLPPPRQEGENIESGALLRTLTRSGVADGVVNLLLVRRVVSFKSNHVVIVRGAYIEKRVSCNVERQANLLGKCRHCHALFNSVSVQY